MFFRSTLLIPFLFVISCSWWGGENKTSDLAYVETSDVMRGKNVDCIMNTGTFFSDYFQGHSSELEVNEMSSCVESTLDSMFEFAYRDDGIGFNRQRIQNVLRSVSSDRNNLDNYDEVADLVFLLKRLFIGGEKDRFLKSEWEEFKKEMPEFEKALIDAHQSAKLIFYSEKRRSLATREQDYSQIASLFGALDDIKNKYEKNIELDEFNSLVRVLLSVSNLDHFIPLFEAASPIVLPSQKSFENSQKDLFKITWKVFEMQSRYREMSFSEGFLAGESMADLINATKLIVNSLSSWGDSDPENYKFEISDVKNTVRALYNLGFLKNFLSDYQSLNQTLENIFISFFGDDKIESHDLNALKAEVLKWTSGYSLILSKFDFPWIEPTIQSLQQRDFDYTETQHEELESTLNRFVRPKFIASANKPIRILYDQDTVLTQQERFFDISFKHLFLSITASMMKIYSPSIRSEVQSDSEIAVGKEVLRKLFSDFRPIGLGMGFVNPYNCDSTDRIFTEGNSLTFSGDANDTISIFEASEWLGIMISVSSITNHVFTNADEACAYDGTNLFGHNFNRRSCFRDALFNRDSIFADYFPGFSSYINILKSESLTSDFSDNVNDWIDGDAEPLNFDSYKNLIVNSMNSCSYLGREEEFYNFPVSRGEFNTVTAAVIYVENIFQQFDTTGLSSGLWNKVDPDGYDMILDGQEISRLLRAKATEGMKDMAVDHIKEEYGSTTFFMTHNWLRNRLLNLPEGLVKFDRSKVFGLVHDFLSERVELNSLELNFCREVMSSASHGFIEYDTEARLQCEPIR